MALSCVMDSMKMDIKQMEASLNKVSSMTEEWKGLLRGTTLK